MKIIKRGQTASERIWTGECRSCKSIVEGTESEMNDIQHDIREGGSFSWNKCPVCNSGPYGGLLMYPKK